MAIDVFLIVFRKYDTEDLRKLEWKYIVVISAYIFIPATAFLFIRTPAKGPMYGSVTVSVLPQAQTPLMSMVTYNAKQLWCSIAPHWVIFRLVFFYGPIWCALSPHDLLTCCSNHIFYL